MRKASAKKNVADQKKVDALTKKINARTGTFIDNLKLPAHRWFRYPAGFSADWVVSVIEATGASNLIDPFAGSGTSLLAAEKAGIRSWGTEAHSFIYKVATSKLSWDFEVSKLLDYYDELEERKSRTKWSAIEVPPQSLLLKMYSLEVLEELEKYRIAYSSLADELGDAKELRILWLGITGLLRKCSQGGTAQWQYVLPNKRKSKVILPAEALAQFVEQVTEDQSRIESESWTKSATLSFQDARSLTNKTENFELLVTSPPYPNNYDYADSTRLEMTFWREIEGWKDLQSTVRNKLMRSCSQHSAADRLKLESLLDQKELGPILEELEPVCQSLAEIRLTKGGRKTYHTMVASYFLDLSRILRRLRKVMKNDSKLCFVIGDSAPYGVHVPVDEWLASLARAEGFEPLGFEKLRDRNVKWDNRVHKVPLKEGRLWLEG